MRAHRPHFHVRVLVLALAAGMAFTAPTLAAADRAPAHRIGDLLHAATNGLWAAFVDLVSPVSVRFAADDGTATGDGTTSDDGTTGDPGGLDPGSGTGAMDPNGSV